MIIKVTLYIIKVTLYFKCILNKIDEKHGIENGKTNSNEFRSESFENV